MSSATPWWGTLVVAAVGFVGILISQWQSGRREKRKTETEHQEVARQRRVEAYGEFMALFQAVIFAFDGPGVDRPNEQQVIPLWNALSKQGFIIKLLAPPGVAQAIDGVITEFDSVMQLTRQGVHDSPELRAAYKRVDDSGDHLSRCMREDAVGDGFEPNWGNSGTEG